MFIEFSTDSTPGYKSGNKASLLNGVIFIFDKCLFLNHFSTVNYETVPFPSSFTSSHFPRKL
jgi:hypothetical protein